MKKLEMSTRRERIAVAVLPALIADRYTRTWEGRIEDAFWYADHVIAVTDGDDMAIEALIAGKPE